MTKHWAIIIGINQYQHLQPLLYAQRDAQQLWNFLVREAGFSPNQCLLLTDISPAFDEFSTYPDRDTLHAWIDRLVKTRLRTDDVLWLFFCGYGAQSDHHDYLMPIEGDLSRVAETGLSVQSLFEQLQQAPTRNILVFLDMNRSQGSLPEHLIGTKTINLAETLEIPTILSCRPEQFSHETLTLRSGLFTQALLEGMRYQGCVTPAQLTDYLRDRLPELSRHHWRPIQHPVAVIPASQKHLLMLPTAVGIAVEAPVEVAAGTGPSLPSQPSDTESSTDGSPPGSAGITRSPEGSTTASSSIVHLPQKPQPSRTKENGFWLRFLGWGALALLLLFAGIIFQNPSLITDGSEAEGDPSSSLPAPDGSAPETSGETADSRAPQQPDATSGSADNSTGAGNSTNAAEDGISLPLISNLFQSDADSTPEQPNSSSPSPNQRGGDTRTLAQAKAALERGNTAEAQQFLDQVPADQRGSEYEALRKAVQDQRQAVLKADQLVLEDAKASIRENQASSFNRAIEAARRIPPGHPLYEEAQESINRWSQVILNLAEGRAAQGSLDSAIAAVQLVPPDRGEISQQAQQRITQWRQQQNNQALIAQANTLIQPGQAHSFQKAILTVRQIPSNQPEYDRAQQLANQWSREMMSIARARAAQARFDSAIQAAQLVPQGTIAYSQAQDEIQRWQAQLAQDP